MAARVAIASLVRLFGEILMGARVLFLRRSISNRMLRQVSWGWGEIVIGLKHFLNGSAHCRLKNSQKLRRDSFRAFYVFAARSPREMPRTRGFWATDARPYGAFKRVAEAGSRLANAVGKGRLSLADFDFLHGA